MQYPLLSGINDPADLKKLKYGDLNRLAAEIRDYIIYTVAHNGGHLASSLGVVELAIALHRVFDSPKDMIVWDVGHQCYAHKLLTGRFKAFSGLRKADGIAGFPKRTESLHDHFNTGHASTSVSAALGMLAADRIKGGTARAIAIIGDGALTGGLAYEALSHAGQLGLPLIVILNDNKMSISANVGGLSKYLSRLSTKAKYQAFRERFDSFAKQIPLIGNAFFNFVVRLKRAVKAIFYIDNFFVDLGFEYTGPIQGHNISGLISVLEDVRKIDRPAVIHVITKKGKGYAYAEENPGIYHGVSSFSVNSGIDSSMAIPAYENNQILRKKISFTDAFGSAMLSQAERDARVVALTAAMEQGCGLSSFKKAFANRFFDVGIAEEHAVTFAAGLAARGLKPVVAVYSTFMQRSVDQIIHDAALQNLPLVLALDRAGFVADDGETHQGLFDISLMRSVPNSAILAPASEAELRIMLNWALEDRTSSDSAGFADCDNAMIAAVREKTFSGSPVILRYPKCICPPEIPEFSNPLELGRGVFISGRHDDSRICLAFTGSLYPHAVNAAALLSVQGIKTDLYNLRFLKPVDEKYLSDIISSYELFVVIEEGIRHGGFGEYVSSIYKKTETALMTIAVNERFVSLGTREQLLKANGLDAESIAKTVFAKFDVLKQVTDSR